jgi:hypothetical protein
LVVHGTKTKDEVSGNLITPVVDQILLKKHQNSGRRIVAIYPESISGNPINAHYVIRWVLNFPSLLGGPVKFDGEVVLAYSQVIADSMNLNSTIDVLFIPALKYKEILAFSEATQRDRSREFELVYAQKYRSLGGKPEALIHDSVEITRFGRKAPSRLETLRSINNASVVHVYENTTVVTEALLLGTPVICHKNEYFDKLIAENELGMSGVSWNPQVRVMPDALENMKVLRRVEEESPARLVSLFSNLKLVPMTKVNGSGISIPRRGRLSRHSIGRARVVFVQKGPMVFLRFTWNYLFR